MSILIPSIRSTVAVPPWTKNQFWLKARAMPSLDLRFADNKSLTDAVSGQNLISFARATTGTYVGSDGVIKPAAVNEPRFDHNPTTGESLGLLVEEARTNLLLRSEEFNNSSWSKTDISVTENNASAPNGTSTACKLVEDLSTGGHVLIQSFSEFSDNTTHTISVFCKAAERDWVALTFVDKSGALNRVWYNLSTGTQGTTNGTVTAFRAISFANGWYRLSVSASTATGAGAFQVRLSIGSADNTASYIGNGTSGLYIWGAQLEAGSFPTSYIPTTTAAATRSADLAQMTGTDFSSWYRQDEGTMLAEFNDSNSSGSRYPYAISDNTINNRFTPLRSGTSSLLYRIATAGTQANPGSQTALLASPIKSALTTRAVTDGAIAALGGTLSTPATPTSSPTVDRLYIGANHAGSEQLSGTIRRLTYWPTRLSNATLQALTQ